MGNFQFWWFHRKDPGQNYQNQPYIKCKNYFFVHNFVNSNVSELYRKNRLYPVFIFFLNMKLMKNGFFLLKKWEFQSIFSMIMLTRSSERILTQWTHLCRAVRSTFAVRETASLGIMGAPRVPPLNPSESIVLSECATLVCFDARGTKTHKSYAGLFLRSGYKNSQKLHAFPFPQDDKSWLYCRTATVFNL